MRLEVSMLLCLAAVSMAAKPTLDDWTSYKAKFGKTYHGLEEKTRFQLFLKNWADIEAHNRLYEQGKVSYSLAVNQFADMTESELRARNGYLGGLTDPSYPTHVPSGGDVPDSLDWRFQKVVTAVKDQKHCGSCWAFSSTGALEGAYALKTGQLISLSEQNLVDCTKEYGNEGCQGGWMNVSFNYISDNGGIDTEEMYPYMASEMDRCYFDPKSVGATDIGSMAIEFGNEDDLKDAVANIGPIAVAIDASPNDFYFYNSGVYESKDCDPENLIHAVLVVGYGNINGKDYWLVKNSWGYFWGVDGYIRMARNANNMCGIASAAMYPVV